MFEKVEKETLERIKKRLEDFKSLPKENYFYEFMFCLLTPQSSAQKCWSAVEQLKTLNEFTEYRISEILKTRTRFHNTKARRILNSKSTFLQILKLLNMEDKRQLRNILAEKVNGYGLKESGHFLRNIGHSNNQIAILDRHILRNLKAEGIIQEDKIKNKKHYWEIESKFLNFAKEQQLNPDELDLIWWSKENGEIFK